MIHLPNEILSIIINELSPDEKAALASCRLACHTLCSLATPLLFSSIQLTGDESSYDTGSYETAIPIRAVKLNQILIDNNDIATSIRSLVLRYNTENYGSSGIIASILRHLAHIQDFTLEVLTSHYYLEFSSIPKKISSAIQALLRSRHLTKLDLSNISDFPLALITTCTNLQNLRLSRIQFSKNVHDTPTMQDSHLNSLEIDESSLYTLSEYIEKHSSFQEYFSRLKNLQIEHLSGFPTCMIWNYTWDIVRVASQNLTTLVIGSSYVASNFLQEFPYDLNWFPSLQHVEIQLRILFPVNNILLLFLNQFLSISSSTSLVETLCFTLGWICDESVEPGHTKDLFSPDAGWSALDKILTSDKFPCLSRVVFDLYVDFEEMVVMGESIDEHFYRELELAKRLTLPCIDALLPMSRGLLDSQQRTLVETHISFVV